MTVNLKQPAGSVAQFIYVCLVCGEAFEKVADHDFDVCRAQYEMELKWRLEDGEVIHAN
jgi:hypothetical protein